MYLERKDLPPHLQHLHSTGKIRVEVTDSVTIHADAGTWSGGTREIYTAVELATGRAVSITDTFSAPWSSERTSKQILLKPGYAIAKTGSWCGKSAGLTLFMMADNAAPLLPAPAQLTPDEQHVIDETCRLKSGYRVFTPAQQACKPGLIARGFLTKQGAVTVKGRNARSPTY